MESCVSSVLPSRKRLWRWRTTSPSSRMRRLWGGIQRKNNPVQKAAAFLHAPCHQAIHVGRQPIETHQARQVLLFAENRFVQQKLPRPLSSLPPYGEHGASVCETSPNDPTRRPRIRPRVVRRGFRQLKLVGRRGLTQAASPAKAARGPLKCWSCRPHSGPQKERLEAESLSGADDGDS